MALLHQGAGSTLDHFLRGPLETMGLQPIEWDASRDPPPGLVESTGGIRGVVVVRYLPRPWLGVLRDLRRLGIDLTFLMDDDLLDPAAIRELPKPYRQRLWQRITRRRHLVPHLFERLWVTSDHLAGKYAHLGALLLPLRPHPCLLASRPRLQLAYLGTSVHEAEFHWLLPLIASLQQRHPHTHVDLFGDLSINRLFRDLPRVRVIHPMGWPNFLAETGAGRLDLLLCPLLAGPFNAARAPTKVIDAARCSAAGLYSDRPPYRGFIRHGVDGLLLGDRQEDWLAAIERLITDPIERDRLARGGRQLVGALSCLPPELPGWSRSPRPPQGGSEADEHGCSG